MGSRVLKDRCEKWNFRSFPFYLWRWHLGTALGAEDWNGADEDVFGVQQLKELRGRDFCVNSEIAWKTVMIHEWMSSINKI